jgi:hypothetical protein
VGAFAPHADHPLVDPTRSEVATPGAEYLIDAAVSRIWRLYGERDTINAVLFDGTPSSWLKYHVNYQQGRFRYLPIWVKLRPDQFDETVLRATWQTPRLTLENTQLTYLRMACEKAAAEDVPFVLLWGAINHEVVEAYGLVDPADYDANRDLVRRMVEDSGGRFIDLDEGFPPELIADSVHPFAEGYGWMAERLYGELGAVIDALETARRAEVSGR